MNNKITEDYCSFEVSKLLKEKGFTWNSRKIILEKEGLKVETGNVEESLDYKFNCYNEDGKPIRPNKYTETNKHYPRPTHALAIKWIRENFGYYIGILISTNTKYSYSIQMTDGEYMQITSNDYDSPEEATEAALKYVLEN